MTQERRAKARELRRMGKSVREISELVSASKGSVSAWVRDIILTEQQAAALQEKQHRAGAQGAGAKANHRIALKKRREYQHTGRLRVQQGDPLHLVGCMLYWAEGAKTKNAIHFVNSDPEMICLFARFLRESLGVSDKEFRIQIQCHTNDPTVISKIEEYWLTLLELPASCLTKTQTKKGSSSRHNILVNGVVGIRIFRTDLVQHIYGAIQEYAGFEREEWLF